MPFKNITTATNQILGRIAGTQHHAWGIRNQSDQKSIYDRPLEFDQWFQKGIRFYESKGYRFQWIDLGTLKVILPNGRVGSRTIDDFHQEWETEYCSQFPSCN